MKTISKDRYMPSTDGKKAPPQPTYSGSFKITAIEHQPIKGAKAPRYKTA